MQDCGNSSIPLLAPGFSLKTLPPMAIHIGCGSWRDKDYVGLLFPKSVPETQRLSHYAKFFDRVELNATYHTFQPRDRIADWVNQTPPGFFFDVKLEKSFSRDPQSAAAKLADRFLHSISPIANAGKLRAFLLTLDPSFGPQRHRLDELDGIAENFSPLAPVAVELRDRAWIEGDALASTLAYFRARKFAWVALDLPRLDAAPLLPPIDEVTHPALAYLRCHGRNPDYLKKSDDPKARHNHDYSVAELREIAARIRFLATKAADVHVSLNNHYRHFAPKAALALRQLLGQPTPPPLPPDRPDDQLSFF